MFLDLSLSLQDALGSYVLNTTFLDLCRFSLDKRNTSLFPTQQTSFSQRV